MDKKILIGILACVVVAGGVVAVVATNSAKQDSNEKVVNSRVSGVSTSESVVSNVVNTPVTDFSNLQPIVIDGVEYGYDSNIEDFLNNGWKLTKKSVEVVEQVKKGERSSGDVTLYKDEYVNGSPDNLQLKTDSFISMIFSIPKKDGKYSYDDLEIDSLQVYGMAEDGGILENHPNVSFNGIGFGTDKKTLKTIMNKETEKDYDMSIEYYYDTGDSILFYYDTIDYDKVNWIVYKMAATRIASRK